MTRVLAICMLLALPVTAGARLHHLLIISGIGGTPAYNEQFANQSRRLATAAQALGIDASRILRLGADSVEHELPADKASILAAIRAIADKAGPDDQVFLVLIGHGNARGEEAVFNLPGPDISASELALALDELGERRVVVVNTASASGPFARRLSGDNRVVITATSSAREYHAPLFGEYFIAAFDTSGADRDKDERISLLEAFEFARREVGRAYDSEKRLLIEHALLDDNGDGEGSLDPGEFEPDGALAHRTYLQQPPTAQDGASRELVALQDRKLALEQSISELKQRRDSLEHDSYYQRLESLLVDLALLARRIRAQGG